MAPSRLRVVFKAMDRAERLGLRALRREFGEYGEVVCAALRVDSSRQPESAEVEFADDRTTLKMRQWTGNSSDLPLYRSEGLVDAQSRDEGMTFLCYVDNFGHTANTFADLEAFAAFVTDSCSATLLSAALCWSGGRGVFAQLECHQKVDQERIISKVMSELYKGRRLSCSSVVGGEYSGIGDGGYRVDWAVVVGEAAIRGLEAREGKRLKKKERQKEKVAKKQQKKTKKGKKEKKKQSKSKKKSKKKKERKKQKLGKKKAKAKATSSDDASTSSSSSSSASADASSASGAPASGEESREDAATSGAAARASASAAAARPPPGPAPRGSRQPKRARLALLSSPSSSDASDDGGEASAAASEASREKEVGAWRGDAREGPWARSFRRSRRSALASSAAVAISSLRRQPTT